MNDNIYEPMDLTSPVMEELSPYDEAYPMLLLSNGLKARLAQAQKVAQAVYTAVIKEAPILAQVQQALKKGCRYVVDASESTLEALESGKIKFTTEKSGEMFAQLRESNGQYGSKVPIKKELFRRGVDPVQMANALQMQALQEQLQEIANQIVLIDQSVHAVLQGQQNDRIGLYYSGMALFLESKNIEDAHLRKALTAQALRALSESTFQLVLTMQSDIQYLVNKEYESAKGKRVNLIDEHMRTIHQSFAFVHQATMLRAGIYCDQGETSAMATVLSEYAHFIEGTVARNATLLAQYDTADNGTDNGVWKSRAKLKLDVASFKKQLNLLNKTVYLGISEENA